MKCSLWFATVKTEIDPKKNENIKGVSSKYNCLFSSLYCRQDQGRPYILIMFSTRTMTNSDPQR